MWEALVFVYSLEATNLKQLCAVKKTSAIGAEIIPFGCRKRAKNLVKHEGDPKRLLA